MVGPLDAINGVAAIIFLGTSYAQNNAWTILLLLAVGYVVKTKGRCMCVAFIAEHYFLVRFSIARRVS